MKKRSMLLLICLCLLAGMIIMLPNEAKAVATGETTIVTEPTVDTAYKFRIDQNKVGSTLFFDGNTDSSATYRLASTPYFSLAVDVYLEKATGGYRLYFMDGSTKTYIRIYEYQDGNAGYGKGTLQLTTSVPTEVLTWNSTFNTLVYKADADNSYYLGTYSSYETFSVSNTSYLKTSNVDVSQFPARLAIAEELEDIPDVSLMIDEYPDMDTPYYLQMKQLRVGDHLFFNGCTDYSTGTARLDTVDSMSAAVDVYLEEATSGYYLYFMNGGTKTYIRIYESVDGERGAGQGGLELVTTAPAEALQWDSNYYTLVYPADEDNSYYLGANGTDSTFGVYNTYIMDSSNVDVTQYPAHLTVPGGIEGGLKYTVQNGEATIVGPERHNSMTEVVIPETVGGYPVRTIAKQAFYCEYYITTVTIPSSITYIGEAAFGFCSNLTSVHISDMSAWLNMEFASFESNPLCCAEKLYLDGNLVTSVVIPQGTTAIKDYAFLYCTSLTSVTIPESVTSIGQNAFNSTGLTAVILPSGLTTIGSRAFEGCTDLTAITIPENVTDIGYEAFDGCTGLTEIRLNAINMNDQTENSCIFANAGKASGGVAVTVGAKVQKIPAYLLEPYYSDMAYVVSVTFEEGSVCAAVGDYAFYRCQKLTAITLPDSVTEIGVCAFSRNTALQTVNCGSGITKIGQGAFSGCTALSSVTLPDTLSSIGSSAFSNCTALSAVTLPAALTSIEAYAFSGCTALTSITIPENVTNIGEEAFADCTGLTEICFNAVNMNNPEMDLYPFDGAGSTTGAVVVRIGSLVQRVPSYLFRDANITEVRFEENAVCTSIGEHAFYSCSALTSVVLSDSVTEIGDYAFFDCTALQTVTFGKAVTTIGGRAFAGCKSLTAITLPDNLKTIGENSFSYCTALESVELGNAVTTVGDSAFYYCTALKSVRLNQKLTTIGVRAFYDCSSLESIVIPPSVTTVGIGAFNGCSALNNVFIGEGGWATDICTNEGAVHVSSLASLARINFGSVDANPLSFLKKLCVNGTLVTDQLVIPDGVTSIGSYSFVGLDTVTSVTIPASVTSVGNGAFVYCSAVEAIYISDLRAWCEYETGPLADCYSAKLYLNGQPLSGALVIPDGTKAIGAYAFWYCDQITSVTIPDSVTKIGEDAFRECYALESVSMGEGVEVIESGAFEYCYMQGTLIIPDSVTEIGDYAFYSCGMSELVLGESVASIGDHAFGQCSFTELVIPDSVTHIDNCAFYNGDIESVYVGKRLRKVGKEAFGVNRNLENVYIKDLEAWCKIDFSVEAGATDCSNPLSLGADLYLNGELVTDVVFPEGLTRVEAMVFSGCTSLESLLIPDGVTYIGSYAFQNCPDLTAVSIPDSVLYLDGSAFNGTSALEHVTFGGSEDQWETLSTSSTNTVDVSHVANVHCYTLLEIGENCTSYGLYCPDCDEMLTFTETGTGSHTYTNSSDLVCNVCGYKQCLERIELRSWPQVTEYLYQEIQPEVSPLDVTGAELRAYYDDGGFVDVVVTEDMVTGLDVCVLGEQELTVTYEGQKTYYSVSVVEEFAPKPLMLMINSLPDIRSYAVGDALNLEGLVLAAFYEDGIEEIPWWWASYSAVDMSTPGKKRVEVEYEGLTTAFDIWVHEFTYTELDSSFYPDPELLEGPEGYYYFSAVDAGQTNVGSIIITFDETSNYESGVYTAIYDYNGNFVTVFDGDLSNAEVVVPSEGFNINIYSDIGDLTKGIGFKSIQLGKATHIYENGECFCGAGQSAIGGFVTDTTGGVISSTHTGFDNLGSALGSDAASDWLKLYANVYDADLSLTSDLYIDLNGCVFQGQIITNGYKIYCMDSSTDEYRCDDTGYMYCWDENDDPVAPERYFKTDVTGTIKRYLLIEDGSVPGLYTSHRFYLGITHQTLKPGTDGVGYKAVFYGDEMVAAALHSKQAFGFAMNLEGKDTVRYYKTSASFISGKTVTLRIDNFDVENFGETNLYASVMLKLADGTVIESTQCVMTLRGMLESLNESYEALTAAQLTAVADFIKKYAIVQTWKVENLV